MKYSGTRLIRDPIRISLLCGLLSILSACSNSRRSLYDVASAGDSRKNAIRLMNRGSDVNEVDPTSGWTPLHVAAARGHPKMCDTLIQYGANVNTRDHNGMTPLHLAMASGHGTTTGILLAGGANPSIKNNQGKTPDEMVAK